MRTRPPPSETSRRRGGTFLRESTASRSSFTQAGRASASVRDAIPGSAGMWGDQARQTCHQRGSSPRRTEPCPESLRERERTGRLISRARLRTNRKSARCDRHSFARPPEAATWKPRRPPLRSAVTKPARAAYPGERDCRSATWMSGAPCDSPLARLAASSAAKRRERSVRGPCFSAEGGAGACPSLANPDRPVLRTRPAA